MTRPKLHSAAMHGLGEAEDPNGHFRDTPWGFRRVLVNLPVRSSFPASRKEAHRHEQS
jgi:hypothetical protein